MQLSMPYQETHGRTMLSLTRTDENLSASLLKVTALENSLSAAGEKFIFMQKLRDFVSVICDFLQVCVYLIYEFTLYFLVIFLYTKLLSMYIKLHLFIPFF